MLLYPFSCAALQERTFQIKVEHAFAGCIYANCVDPGTGRIPPDRWIAARRTPLRRKSASKVPRRRFKKYLAHAISMLLDVGYSSYRIPVSRANVTVNRHSQKVARPAPQLEE